MHTLNEEVIETLFEARYQDMEEMHQQSVGKIMDKFKVAILKKSRHGRLVLSNMQLGVNSAKLVGQLLLMQSQIYIKYLDLSNNNLGDQGVQLLAKSLGAENKSLVYLNLSSNNLTHSGAQHLFQRIELNQSLIELDLSNEVEGNSSNKLGSQGALLLANLLSR